MGTTNYSNLLNQKSTKFYSDSSNINSLENMKNNLIDLSEKIQINIGIKNFEKGSSYQIHLFNIADNKKNPLNDDFECSSTDDLTTYLIRPVIIRFYFEKQQPLLIKIIKKDFSIEKNYEIKTTLGCIMGSRNNTWESKIISLETETLIVKAEKLKESEKVIKILFDINAIDKKVSFSSIKCKMYYEIFSDIILYRSECLSDNGIFDPVKIPVGLFKNNKITVIFYKSNRKIRGNYTLDIDDFVNETEFKFRVNGVYFRIISKSKITQNYTFVDYLNAKLDIGLSVAIDFTASNGNPSDINSLHSITSLEPNQYERAIRSCGNILSYYDSDQYYPCFGFGAKIGNTPYPIFNLNFEKDPNIKFIDGIINAYHKALKSVQLYGPTFFGPIIREMNNFIKKENDYSKYYILMILTDGIIDDLDNTIEELVEVSNLPLSVIIIGVGKADFTNMNILDADENPLNNSKGIKATRDLVQFVPFIKYEAKPENLTNEVLAEIPRQIIEYYEQKNLDPKKLAAMKKL